MNRFLLALVLVGAARLAAQDQEPANTAEAAQLRAEVERRFAERVQTQLGLTDDQAVKLKSTQERFGVRRRDILRRQLLHRLALQEQMRPDVRANPDSVRVHMDGMQAGRVDMARLDQDEDREMAGYLTPVQRAQFQFLRQRLIDRVTDVRRGRQERRRERVRPRVRPRGRPY